MLNPFCRFEEKFISTFLNLKKQYLVSQTLRLSSLAQIDSKTFLLFTHYSDKGLAKIHFNAVSTDKLAAIIDLENSKHRQKVLGMLNPESQYIIYSSLTIDPKELKTITEKLFTQKIHKYIAGNTNWSISRDHTIKPRLEITFGELYVNIKYKSQNIRMRLQELENL